MSNRKLLIDIYKKMINFDHTKIPEPNGCPHCSIMCMIRDFDYTIKIEVEKEYKRR